MDSVPDIGDCMCESGCDTDKQRITSGSWRGFAAQNADHASIDHWLLRYRGERSKKRELGSFQNVRQTG